MIWIRKDFSYLSAICPAVEENKKKRQYKEPCHHCDKYLGIEPVPLGKSEGDKYDQGVFKEVIVKRAKKLRKKERQKTPGGEEFELSLYRKNLQCTYAAAV